MPWLLWTKVKTRQHTDGRPTKELFCISRMMAFHFNISMNGKYQFISIIYQPDLKILLFKPILGLKQLFFKNQK